MATIFWMQSGACSGDSMSFLNAEDPEVNELLGNYDVELLYHPSLSSHPAFRTAEIISEIRTGKQELTILIVEGAILNGPGGSGYFDTFHGEPKRDIIRDLANHARFVIAVGTCSTFGGIPASGVNPGEATGLQFTKGKPGGLLDKNWKTGSGFPVINLSGCPVHPSTITEILTTLLLSIPLELDGYNRPADYYKSTVHQGCTRNEYHEFDVEEMIFGENGCLFYYLGCQGPYTMGSCNQTLWNRKSSKTRAGVPCFGCTSPDFPGDFALFETEKLGSVPVNLPLGVNRPSYMAYKGLSSAATPQRLLDRDNYV